MHQSIHRIHRTIDDLTTLIRRQQGVVEKAEPIFFRNVVRDVLLDLQILLERNPVNVDLTGISQEMVNYGPGELRCILYNLLTNAIQFTNSDQQVLIDIAFYAVNDAIILDVRDNRLGMDPLQRAFLSQLANRVHQCVPGTGIGAYVINQIIEQNGGYIEIFSDADSGTTVRIYLKAARSANAHVRSTGHSLPEMPG